jgi:hypothetical protein
VPRRTIPAALLFAKWTVNVAEYECRLPISEWLGAACVKFGGVGHKPSRDGVAVDSNLDVGPESIHGTTIELRIFPT